MTRNPRVSASMVNQPALAPMSSTSALGCALNSFSKAYVLSGSQTLFRLTIVASMLPSGAQYTKFRCVILHEALAGGKWHGTARSVLFGKGCPESAGKDGVPPTRNAIIAASSDPCINASSNKPSECPSLQ
eukprot:3415152-Prymnesium_polylepis.2